jgi:hypothetical protein
VFAYAEGEGEGSGVRLVVFGCLRRMNGRFLEVLRPDIVGILARGSDGDDSKCPEVVDAALYRVLEL